LAPEAVLSRVPYGSSFMKDVVGHIARSYRNGQISTFTIINRELYWFIAINHDPGIQSSLKCDSLTNKKNL
jgi:hypothetical protein